MKLIAGIVSGLMLAAAVPAFASDTSADRAAAQKRDAATASAKDQAAKAACACACGMKHDRA